jgi:hypothetical protein
MATQINGVTVAEPFDFSASIERMGSIKRSVNGTILLDYFATQPKYKIKLQWRLLTSAERSTLYSQFTACITGARTLLIPDGRSFTVYLDMEADITETIIRDAVGYKYNVTANFIEA